MLKLKKILFSLLLLSVLTVVACLIWPVGYFITSNIVSDTKAVIASGGGNYSGIGAYIINLDRSKDRYEYVKPTISALNFPTERISAVDGKKLTYDEISRVLDKKAYQNFIGSNPRKGTIGCSLSHINTWQKFLDSNYEFALIFEDDVSFEPDKLRAAIEDLIQYKHLWDLTLFEIVHKGTPLTIKKLPSGPKMVIYLSNVSHAGAYLINRAAASKMLAKALPIQMPIDHYFTRSWEFGITLVGVEEPRLVRQSFDSSEIAKTQQIATKPMQIDLNQEDSITLAQKAKKMVYIVQSSVIRFVYNLKLYFMHN
jgi:glycosyl transferase family 25